MTCDEFNEKYKEWLEKGHYGLAVSNVSIINWLDKEVFPSLIKIEGFQYSQIKWKFTSFRFYSNLYIIVPFFGSKLTDRIEEEMYGVLNNTKDVSKIQEVTP